MKDILIKSKKLKKELIILVACFIISVLLNIYSIVKYKTDWSELIGQMHIVVLIAVSLWVLISIFRLMFWGFQQLFKNNEGK